MEEVSAEDFKRFEAQYVAERAKGEVLPGTQFNYAWCLIKSPDKNNIKKGVDLLQGLCHSGTDQRDYLYFIAEGNFKINEYQLALKYVNRLLQIEPSNRQGLELQESIKQKMKEDALTGLGILGAGALLFGGVAAVAGFLLAKRK